MWDILFWHQTKHAHQQPVCESVSYIQQGAVAQTQKDLAEPPLAAYAAAGVSKGNSKAATLQKHLTSRPHLNKATCSQHFTKSPCQTKSVTVQVEYTGLLMLVQTQVC
jgi:hypothetical protein